MSDASFIVYCRYDSTDPLDLGEALWLAHWGLGGDAPGQHQQQAHAPWARVVSRTSLAALGELWDAGYFTAPRFARLAFLNLAPRWEYRSGGDVGKGRLVGQFLRGVWTGWKKAKDLKLSHCCHCR